jgi:hypothetical protein
MNKERPTATLLNFGGTRRLATVYIELIDRTNPDTGVAEVWSGYFQIAAGDEPEWDIQAFTLQMEDGRKGQCMVTYRHSFPTVFVFKNLGPLA